MSFLCDYCYIQAKFYDQPYRKCSNDLKNNIIRSSNRLRREARISEELDLLDTLLTIIEVLNEDATIRKGLIDCRKNLELLVTADDISRQSVQMIEMAIELINFYLHSIVYCTTLNSIMNRYEILKYNIKEFKVNQFIHEEILSSE